MTSRLEQEINGLWASFSESYKKMGDDRQAALDYIKDAIIGEIQPKSTENRISTLEGALEDVATGLSGNVRTFAAKMIDAYAAHVGRSKFKREHPEKYEELAKLSKRLGTIYINGLRNKIREQKKEHALEYKQVSNELSQSEKLHRSAERSGRFCNRAFVVFQDEPCRAYAKYVSALAIEPNESRIKAIHALIGGLLYNNKEYDRALVHFKLSTKDPEVKYYRVLCESFIRQGLQPVDNPLSVPEQGAQPRPRARRRARPARENPPAEPVQAPERVDHVPPARLSEIPQDAQPAPAIPLDSAPAQPPAAPVQAQAQPDAPQAPQQQSAQEVNIENVQPME